jgi:hypothetical protein
MTLPRLLTALTITTILFAACSTEDSCDPETVVVTIPTTIELDGQQSAIQFEGRVTQANIGSAFLTVREFLIGSAIGGAIWTTEALNPGSPVDFAAFQLSGPLAPGEVIPVTTVLIAAGWGEPLSPEPSFGAGAENFTPATVSGSFTVRGISPLRMGIDVTASDESRNLRFQGEMTTRREGDVGCV